MFTYGFLALSPILLTTSRISFSFILSFFSFISLVLVFINFSLFTSNLSYFSLLYTSDFVSAPLVYITVLVILLSYCSYTSFSETDSISVFFTYYLLLLSSYLVFTTSNVFVLYVAYESSLIPISYVILKWGVYPDRGYSAILILMFTSVFTFPLIVVFILQFIYSSSLIFFFVPYLVFDFPIFIFILVLIGFSVKLPVYGIHYWLPMAHVEAPTYGSMVLAGLLLKMGGCGLIRFTTLFGSLFSFLSSIFLSYIIFSISLVSFICVAQSDIKRLVAYSSVLHITVICLLILSNNSLSISVVVLLIVFHGLASPMLFHLVGLVYSLYNTRLMLMLRGLLLLSPALSLMATFSFLVSIPVPPFPSFISEVLTFVSSYYSTVWVSLCAIIMLFLVIVYSLSWFIPLVFTSRAILTFMGMSSVNLISLLIQFSQVFISMLILFVFDIFLMY